MNCQKIKKPPLKAAEQRIIFHTATQGTASCTQGKKQKIFRWENYFSGNETSATGGVQVPRERLSDGFTFSVGVLANSEVDGSPCWRGRQHGRNTCQGILAKITLVIFPLVILFS
jgi:hypothetical protein